MPEFDITVVPCKFRTSKIDTTGPISGAGDAAPSLFCNLLDFDPTGVMRRLDLTATYCILTNCSDQDCPVARFAQSRISLGEAKQRVNNRSCCD